MRTGERIITQYSICFTSLFTQYSIIIATMLPIRHIFNYTISYLNPVG